LSRDMALLREYGALLAAEERTSFLGRLGTYRYINMDQAIGEALDLARAVRQAARAGRNIPRSPPGVTL
jgi:UDP-galactopyranose mutase